MSNRLSVRRVKVQTIDANGNPIGDPTFGVMASDTFVSDYNDTFESLEALNKAITEAGCILDVVDADFGKVNRNVVGTDNYCGMDWQVWEGE